jgi:hypothetical protein
VRGKALQRARKEAIPQKQLHNPAVGPDRPVEDAIKAAKRLAGSMILKTGALSVKGPLGSSRPVGSAKYVHDVVEQYEQALKKYAPGGEVQGDFTNAQKEYIDTLSRETGLRPEAVGAWVLGESGGKSSGLPDWDASGYYNYLNIGPWMDAPEFSDPHSAAHATAEFLKGNQWGAGANIPSIIPNSKGKTAAQQLSVIEQSGWSATGYGTAEGAGTLPGLLNQIKVTPENPGDVRKLKAARAQVVQAIGKGPTKLLEAGGELVSYRGGGSEGPVRVTSAKDELQAGAIVKASKEQAKYFNLVDGNERPWFDPVLMDRLVKLAKASGEPIQLNSGFRTLAEQEAAYADYQAGGATAAVPGSSNHEFGLAADVELTDTQRSMLGDFGLGLPVADEDWHVEVVDGSKQVAVNLGTAGGSATVEGGPVKPDGIKIKGTNLWVTRPEKPAGAAGASGSVSGAPGGSVVPTSSAGAPGASRGAGGRTTPDLSMLKGGGGDSGARMRLAMAFLRGEITAAEYAAQIAALR